MKSRHRARRLALQALCVIDVQGLRSAAVVEQFIADSDETEPTLQLAREMLKQSLDLREEADKLLARHARQWEVSRLALVDRNILRLAIGEMLSAAAPPKVVINEAIRLGQEFSSAESPRFINALLDAVAKEIQRETGAAPADDSHEDHEEHEEQQNKTTEDTEDSDV